MLMIGCTSSRTLVHHSPGGFRNELSLRASIAREANTFVGTKYRYGGKDRKGLDCSGLVFTVYQDHALALPRSSSEQMKIGKRITANSAQVGDLIFFQQNGRINHVAIVTDIRGNDLWVTHSTTSRGVIREKLYDSAYWSSRIEGVRDIISTNR